MTGIIKRMAGMLLTMAWLAGCSHATPETAPRAAAQDAAATEHYFAQVMQRIQANFTDYQPYIGQQCEVTIERRADGGYNVIRTEGDEPLCLKAWQSVSSTRNFPLPPKDAAKTLVMKFLPDKPA